MRQTDQRPLGRCDCGHSGGALNSQHSRRMYGAAGHGPCKKCDCPQFTWAAWIRPPDPCPRCDGTGKIPRGFKPPLPGERL